MDAATISTNAGITSTAYSPPANFVRIAAGANIQAAVDANPTGTVFLLSAGTYTGQTIRAKSGDSFYGENGQAVLNGAGAQHAFEGQNVTNVTISGLKITNYAPPDQGIGALGTDGSSADWIVQACEFSGISSSVPIMLGDRMIVRDNYFHDNQVAAIGGWNVTGAVVTHNEIAHNNLSGSGPFTATGGGAGIKIAQATGTTIANNSIHDNLASPGVWTDINCSGTVIQGNRIANNDVTGIIVELDYGALIKDNLIEGNNDPSYNGFGGGGIYIQNSQNAEVTGNILRGNVGGIWVYESDRGSGTQGPWVVANDSVHGNLIQLSGGSNGMGGNVQASDVKWYANTYYLSGTAQLINGGTASVSQWQAAGLDTTTSGTTFNSGAMPSDPTTGGTGSTPVAQTIGSGTDSLVLKVSQDYYQGNAQYTVSVDGQQIGGTLTAGAIAGSGQDDTLTVKGNWAAGSHTVQVSFVNDLAGASPGQDRNLHIDGVSFAGTALANGTALLYSNGSTNFAFSKAATSGTGSTPVVQTIGSGTDSLVLKISQDYYLGNAQYTVSVDGKQIGGTLTAGAIAGSGQDDTLTVKGNWAAGSHTVQVNFVNDLADALPGQDRNLHIDGVSFAGTALANSTALLYSNGSTNFAFSKAVATSVDTVPAMSFGVPGTWGQNGSVWEGHTTYGGQDFHTFRATTTWGGVLAAQTAPTSWATTNATHLAFDNIEQLQLNLSAAGTTGLGVLAVAARFGSITTGSGDDTITWVAHSDASGANNIMKIRAGAGNDTVHITAVGLSPLAQSHATGDGSQYNAAYTGKYSTADVYFVSGNDTVTVEGDTRLVMHGGNGYATATGGSGADIFYVGTRGGDFTGGAGNDAYVFRAGNAHVTIEDFSTGHDRLKFVGLAASGVTTKLATENGVAGLLVTYDTAGDSVFLAHVTKLGAADMVFA